MCAWLLSVSVLARTRKRKKKETFVQLGISFELTQTHLFIVSSEVVVLFTRYLIQSVCVCVSHHIIVCTENMVEPHAAPTNAKHSESSMDIKRAISHYAL